jgi:hypothetical protein
MNFGRADHGRVSVSVLAGLGLLLLCNTPRDVISKTATAHLQNTHGMHTLSRPSTEGLHAQPRLVEIGGSSPLSFEANAGQTDPRVKFLSRGHGYTLFLTSDEAVFSLRKGHSSVVSRQSQGTKHSRPRATNGLNPKSQIQNAKSDAPEVLRLKLVGANPAPRIVGQEELPSKINYLIGNDPAKWRTNIPTYAQVRYENVYPGIDLVYYGQESGVRSQESEGRTEKSEVRSQKAEANPQAPPAGRMELEFDFVVAPGADPKAITFKVEGAVRPLHLNAQGDLVVRLGGGGSAVPQAGGVPRAVES